MTIDPVYILIRTSSRPRFFAQCMASIESQTYPNIKTIVHSDDPRDDYVNGDIIIRSKRNPHLGRGHYNLYCNKLLEAIPAGDGWYHFIDDDDMYYANDVIEKLVEKSKRNFINVARVQRWNKVIFPKEWGKQRGYQTECFFLHADHRGKARWWSKRGGDHNYSKQLTQKLKINWIDGIIICKAQMAKGRGLRYDLDQQVEFKEYTSLNRISAADSRHEKRILVRVLFNERVFGRSVMRGLPGQVKKIPLRYAVKLEKTGSVKILK